MLNRYLSNIPGAWKGANLKEVGIPDAILKKQGEINGTIQSHQFISVSYIVAIFWTSCLLDSFFQRTYQTWQMMLD